MYTGSLQILANPCKFASQLCQKKFYKCLPIFLLKWVYHKLYIFPFKIFDTNWPSLLRSCPTMVKSAVLPKTTSLCGSILVITLCCRVTQYWKQIFTSSSFNYADQNLEYFCYAVLQWQKYSCKRRILIINWSHFAKHIHLKLNFCRIWICFPQKFYFKRSCFTLFIIYYSVFWYFSWLNKTNTGVIRILQYFQYSSLKIKRKLEECLKSLNNFNFF